MKVNAYTGGSDSPSARYRIRQLIPSLAANGVVVNEIVSKAGTYPPKDKFERPLWVVRNIIENFGKVLNQPESDMSFIQREFLTKHSTFEGFLNGPRIFDVDDAIFLLDDGLFAKRIAGKMQKIICGNSFLANKFSEWNSNIDIIPTAVDVLKFDEITCSNETNIQTIVWSGSSSGFKFVYNIEEALKRILNKHPNARLRIVSNERPVFRILPPAQVEFMKWTPDIEVSSIKSSSIGIMPIEDNDWSRGKCSYKMLSYMAAKIPVVVSPFGMNEEVLKMGRLGFGAISEDDWFDAIDALIASTSNRTAFGLTGYGIIKENFDISIVAGQVAQAMKSVE